MKKVIYKYPLTSFPECTIQMPEEAKILSLQMQNGVITIWALVNAEGDLDVDRTFLMKATGQPFVTDGLEYLTTIQEGHYVWHVFEVIS